MSTIDQLIENLDTLLQASVKEFVAEEHDKLDQKNQKRIARMQECWNSMMSQYEKMLSQSSTDQLKIVIDSEQEFDEIRQVNYCREDEALPCSIFCDFLQSKGYKPKHTRIMSCSGLTVQHIIKAKPYPLFCHDL